MVLKHLLDWIPLGSVPEITPATLARWVDDEHESVELLDVRTRAEFEGGHLANARHVPITSFASTLPGLALEPGRRVVAICASGHRSIVAVRLLRRRGVAGAVQLAGGMRGWRAAGGATVR